MAAKNLPSTLGDLSLGAAKKCPRGYILRTGYETKKGVEVGPACVPDTGKPGKTPAAERILPKPEPGALKGWSKDRPAKERRKALEKITKREGCATVIRRLTLLQNITTDKPTERLAMEDKEWLRGRGFCELKSKKKP